MYLAQAAIRRVQEMSWQLSSCHTAAELEASARQWLLGALPSDHCAFHDFRAAPVPLRLTITPDEHRSTQVQQVVLEHLAERGTSDHPLMLHHFGPGLPVSPVRLSDLASQSALRRTAAYQEVLKRWSVNYQLVLIHRRRTPVDGGGYAMNRAGRDFTEAEVDLATAVQPVLLALHTAVAAAAPTIDAAAALRFGLTSAESEVLCLVAAGLTAVAIGHLRRTSPRTVRKHLESIYGKLGYHDRLQAVSYARQVGLL